MSKLEKLIQKYSAAGVEYKTVEDVAVISRGRVISKGYLKDNEGYTKSINQTGR